MPMTTLLGIDCERLMELGSDWSDRGLWNDVLWLSLRAWEATDEAQRRDRWHHLLMAVGNFKRQRGRRLHPPSVAPVDELTFAPRRADPFDVPGVGPIGPENLDGWLNLGVDGVGDATLTTLLAALWPDRHHILDWRVLAAASALTLGSSNDFGFVSGGSSEHIDPDVRRHYLAVRALLREVVDECECLTLTTLERALYRLTQQVGAQEDRTWLEYRDALRQAAGQSGAPVRDQPGDDGSADDERNIAPDAP
jgi:hypothetical protein